MNIITELLASIKEKKTVNELIRYLASPFINQTDDITDLVRYYAKYYPKFDNTKQLEPEVVVKKAFKKEKPKQAEKSKSQKAKAQKPKTLKEQLARLKDIIKRTSPLIKNFFVSKQLDKDEFTKHRLLLRAYEELSLPDLHEAELRETRRKLEYSNVYGEEEFWNRYFFDKEYFFNSKMDTENRLDAYEDLVVNLDLHYFISKLKITINRNFISSNHIKLSKEEIDEAILQQIKHKISAISNPEDAPPSLVLLLIYFNIYQIQTNPKLSSQDIYAAYIESKSLLEEHDDFISFKEKKPIFHYLLNVLAILLNREGAKFNDEVFELYRLGLRIKAIIVHGELNEHHYINILYLASSLNKLDWLLNEFTNEYLKLLNKNSKDDSTILTRAFVDFQRNNYQEVYDLIIKTNFSTRFFDMRARVLKLKAAYKLNDITLFENTYNSFRLYLARNNKRFGNATIDRHKNFIQLMLYLEKERGKSQAIYDYDITTAKDGLIEELRKGSMVDRQWLAKEIKNL